MKTSKSFVRHYVCLQVIENTYSRIISPLLKFSQIRDGWMKVGIVSSIKVKNLPYLLCIDVCYSLFIMT